MKYIIIGNEIQFQFPSITYSPESDYIENLATNLHNSKCDFYCICPYNPKKKTYPYQVYYTNEYPIAYTKKTAAKYAIECREIINKNKTDSDVLLTVGEWSSQYFFDLNIPMIVTLFRECNDKILRTQILNWDHIHYRFLTKYNYTGWNQVKWLKKKKIILSPGLIKYDNVDDSIVKNKNNYYLYIIYNREHYNYLNFIFKLLENNIYITVISLINSDLEKTLTTNTKYLEYISLENKEHLDMYIKNSKGCFLTANEYFQQKMFHFYAAKCVQYDIPIINLFNNDTVLTEIGKSSVYTLKKDLSNFNEIDNKLSKREKKSHNNINKFSAENEINTIKTIF